MKKSVFFNTVSTQVVGPTACFPSVTIKKIVACLKEVVAYVHAIFFYREGNISVKQNPEMCTAFLLKECAMSYIYCGTNMVCLP